VATPITGSGRGLGQLNQEKTLDKLDGSIKKEGKKKGKYLGVSGKERSANANASGVTEKKPRPCNIIQGLVGVHQRVSGEKPRNHRGTFTSLGTKKDWAWKA